MGTKAEVGRSKPEWKRVNGCYQCTPLSALEASPPQQRFIKVPILALLHVSNGKTQAGVPWDSHGSGASPSKAKIAQLLSPPPSAQMMAAVARTMQLQHVPVP